MTRVHRMSIVAAMILATSTTVFADPITILSAQRRVTVSPPLSAQADGDALFVTVTTPAGTDPASATASLSSSIADPMHWFGTGSAVTTWATPNDLNAVSSLFVDFLVTSPLTYAFDVRLGST